ncbi:MAG: DUF4368 domain-containing protein [Clostridium sp.]|jgi:hypothetical protein|nr:DUF4368 domain-containing protein [Clostridium sp.]
MGSCWAHYIREDALTEVVLTHIGRALRYIQQFEEIFVREKYEQSFEERRKALAEMKRQIVKATHRIAELDKLFKRIYEDNVASRLTDERFQRLLEDYEAEQRQLKLDVERMEADVAKGEEVAADFRQFLASVRKYTDVAELTTTILNEFVEKVIVHEADKSSGTRTQQVDIYLNLIGKFDLPELEETEPQKTVGSRGRKLRRDMTEEEVACLRQRGKERYARKVAAKKAAEQAERAAILKGTAYEIPSAESEEQQIAS